MVKGNDFPRRINYFLDRNSSEASYEYGKRKLDEPIEDPQRWREKHFLASKKVSPIHPSDSLPGLVKIAVNGKALAVRTQRVMSSCLTSKTHFLLSNIMLADGENKSCLGGKISSSFLNLKHLSYLDLSMNNFNGINIPKFLGSIKTLQYLSLSDSFFAGIIPIGVGHLTNLRILDLSENNISGKIPSSFSNLCNLQIFNLKDNKIGGEINEFVNGLFQCYNSNLKSMLLSGNKLLGGNIPYSLGRLKKLKTINLGSCSFWGLLPHSIGDLSSLKVLNLRNNQMRGTIPESIGKLSKLVSLDLSWNLWITCKWVQTFLASWPQTQNELKFLSLHNVGISDTIPPGFWNSCSNIHHLSLSNNSLHGQVPNTRAHHPVFHIDLSSNNLEGPIPLFLRNLGILYLKRNMFSGPIPENVGELLPWISFLDLSSNSITGRIPHSIGMPQKLKVLILRNNYLSGKLPPQWEDLKLLSVLDVANNNLSGTFPSSMQYLSSLRVLSLSQNHFEGGLPSFFRKYGGMVNLDLGDNKFCGNVPAWTGESLTSLRRLSLRSNFFDGNIPKQLCFLSRLQILDLAIMICQEKSLNA
ncbi:LRR receptor-like serine/threonine-protein kinase GSO2 [Corylus avellana]|uniref:LRR receptor-like serine/threonine-protein kinase GSO2 n=1 Tax=Corylus avellana TaxID=13451 RepID=UPI00286C6315|nr:LRR receptor-like serine/threonine-protein kinase GSO2 [Corylus avellana]